MLRVCVRMFRKQWILLLIATVMRTKWSAKLPQTSVRKKVEKRKNFRGACGAEGALPYTKVTFTPSKLLKLVPICESDDVNGMDGSGSMRRCDLRIKLSEIDAF